MRGAFTGQHKSSQIKQMNRRGYIQHPHYLFVSIPSTITTSNVMPYILDSMTMLLYSNCVDAHVKTKSFQLLGLLGFSPHLRMHHPIRMSKSMWTVFLQEPQLYMAELIQHGPKLLICAYHTTGNLLREAAYAQCGVRGMLPVTTTVTLEVKHQPARSYGTSLGGVTVTIEKLLDMQRQTHGRYQ